MNGATKVKVSLHGRERVAGIKGHNFAVTRADDGRLLIAGWSAGSKRDARSDAFRSCSEHGWEVVS